MLLNAVLLIVTLILTCVLVVGALLAIVVCAGRTGDARVQARNLREFDPSATIFTVRGDSALRSEVALLRRVGFSTEQPAAVNSVALTDFGVTIWTGSDTMVPVCAAPWRDITDLTLVESRPEDPGRLDLVVTTTYGGRTPSELRLSLVTPRDLYFVAADFDAVAPAIEGRRASIGTVASPQRPGGGPVMPGRAPGIARRGWAGVRTYVLVCTAVFRSIVMISSVVGIVVAVTAAQPSLAAEAIATEEVLIHGLSLAIDAVWVSCSVAAIVFFAKRSRRREAAQRGAREAWNAMARRGGKLVGGVQGISR